MNVRPEIPADAADVRRVHERAFDTPAEAGLVETLTARLGESCLSLVCEREGVIAGHALFSPAEVEGQAAWPVWVLGPMAVLPEQQKWGVGSSLVEVGLEACRQRGGEAVFVLGHRTYYPRFGFVPAPPLGFTCRWEVAPEYFMVVELQEGTLAGRSGRVIYPDEFERV